MTKSFVLILVAALSCCPAIAQSIDGFKTGADADAAAARQGHGRRVTDASFDGIDASQLGHPQNDIDPNGAIGTKQYMEWVNVYYQAYDKVTHAAVWPSPKVGTLPWQNNGTPNCSNIGGDGLILFDRLASRWIIAARSSVSGNKYYFCIAVSNTDDLSSNSLAWHTYDFPLNSVLGTNSSGNVYFPDWPKMGVWDDAYYLGIDLLDPNNGYQPIGVVACAFDRTNMLVGATANTPQCFSNPNPIPTRGSLYLAHSLIPADVDGTTAPPSGREEYFVSIQNPPHDGVTTTSSSINLWSFHVDWTNPGNSTFSQSSLSVPTYTPGCYNPSSPLTTQCVPEPSVNSNGNHYLIDSVGDRMMPRFAYRNFGSYESFLASHTVYDGIGAKQTGIRWYELRGSGSPTLYQSGLIDKGGNGVFSFMPSIAQDKNGNAAVGYSVSNATVHPGIRAAYFSLVNSPTPTQVVIQVGSGDQEISTQFGDYSSMTVDPVDGCTFWYVNEYFTNNQTNTLDWHTRLGNFKVTNCQ